MAQEIYQKYANWFHAFAAAILVPVLTLLLNQDYLHQLLVYVNPKFPSVLLPLITSPIAGLLGFFLYKLDPNAGKKP
jgi:hypothetical protein